MKPEQNRIEFREQSNNPSNGVCVNRNQSQIRIKVDPDTPASTMSIVITVSSASHVQFVISIGIPKMSGAGSSVCTTARSRRCRCRCRTYNHNMLPVSQQRNHHEPLLLRSAGTVAAVLFETQNDESEVILRTHLLNRTALAARTLKKVAGTPSINHALQ